MANYSEMGISREAEFGRGRRLPKEKGDARRNDSRTPANKHKEKCGQRKKNPNR